MDKHLRFSKEGRDNLRAALRRSPQRRQAQRTVLGNDFGHSVAYASVDQLIEMARMCGIDPAQFAKRRRRRHPRPLVEQTFVPPKVGRSGASSDATAQTPKQVALEAVALLRSIDRRLANIEALWS